MGGGLTSKSFQRLRYVSAKKPSTIEAFFIQNSLVRLIGNPTWDGKNWVAWFIPLERDVKSREIQE